MAPTTIVRLMVDNILDKQDQKWGARRILPTYKWVRIIGEEVDEFNEAAVLNDYEAMLNELADVAASAMSAMQSIIDRREADKRVMDEGIRFANPPKEYTVKDFVKDEATRKQMPNMPSINAQVVKEVTQKQIQLLSEAENKIVAALSMNNDEANEDMLRKTFKAVEDAKVELQDQIRVASVKESKS